MADKILTAGMSGNPLKLHDNGDGTYSLSVKDTSDVETASKKQVWYKARVEVPPNDSIVAIEQTKPTTIDFMEWITHDLGDGSNLGAHIKIEVREGGTWQELTVMRNILNVYPNQSITPFRLYENGSSLWETNAHNVERNIYKYSLRKPITFYEGVRISVVNANDTESKVFGLFIMGSEV